ncbi:hypothetical protein KEJ27_05710 [Candidatus Bathyarchaeota archaeon]|nr:hypothetical protein [Candidatus Bathyarchaeota archaeon]MBS7618286.1 hypothetical protein [Candidatus Bathyarchaeota archaeon]
MLIGKREGKICETIVEHRVYDLNELKSLLAKASLKVIDVFGPSQREKFHETKSSRILFGLYKCIQAKKQCINVNRV